MDFTEAHRRQRRLEHTAVEIDGIAAALRGALDHAALEVGRLTAQLRERGAAYNIREIDGQLVQVTFRDSYDHRTRIATREQTNTPVAESQIPAAAETLRELQAARQRQAELKARMDLVTARLPTRRLAELCREHLEGLGAFEPGGRRRFSSLPGGV